MNTGGFSTGLRTAVLQFNGGLFEDSSALPLDRDQLLLLLEASRSDWRDVEPAIFGTLLERALDPVERHKLGAHYTPRAYVERLVLPTIVEPLRAEWDAVQTAAVHLANAGDLDKAIRQVKDFHQHLSNVRILDPACGTGNFLYVTLEHLKRIEGEIYDLLRRFGDTQAMFELKGYSRRPAPAPRTGDQPARGGDRRAGPLDRHSPVAFPDAGQCPPAPADHPQLPQHPAPRRPDRVRRDRAGA